jgi:fibronectin-binding autotransporter adhesin
MTSHVVSAGVTSTSLTLLAGDTDTVLSGGIASSTKVSSGGVEYISSGGQAFNDLVLSGGLVVVSFGATDSGVTVSAGGVLSGAGTLDGATTVFGLISGVTVNNGEAPATALTVGVHGLASNVTVTDATAEITSGGSARSLIASSATILVDAGASTTGTVLGAGDTSEFDRGSAVGTMVGSGASEFVFSGARALGATVTYRGQVTVLAGGSATSALISYGGSQTISSGGLGSATHILSGGQEIVSSGGLASNSVILSGGSGSVLSDGIASGMLISIGGTEVISAGGVLAFGPTGSAVNLGSIDVDSAGTVELSGSVDNAGVVQVAGGTLLIDGGSATLTGSGHIELTDSVFNNISATAAGDELDNEDNLIDGSGEIAMGQLINRGTIDATGTGVTLRLVVTAATNTGLLEATAAGDVQGLVLTGDFQNSGGVIAGNGGRVILGDCVVSGGAIESRLGGEILVLGPSEFDGTGSIVSETADVVVDDGFTLSLAGAIDNAGSILVSGTGAATELRIDSPTVTLTGSGVIQFSNAVDNVIVGATASDTLINKDNTIEGSADFGSGSLAVINSGTIAATDATYALEIETTSLTNTGLIESTDDASLILNSDIQNSGGVIAANGGVVYLSDTVISGGSLKATTGYFIEGSDNEATLNGASSPLTIAATIYVVDGAPLNVVGAIVNDGIISLAGFSADQLVIDGPNVTLTGSGTVELSDYVLNQIVGAAAADVLDNETNTIEGTGNVGSGSLTLINRGIIDANGADGALVIQTTSATNTGLMEATGAKGLVIESAVANSGGVIAADGGDVYLSAGAVISGGVISGDGGPTDGVILLSGGSVVGMEVAAGAVLEGAGTLSAAIGDYGLVSGPAVASGAVLRVFSGALATAVVAGHGGIETIAAHGAAGGTTLSGGIEYDYGLASGTAVSSGGQEYVEALGTASGSLVSSGGHVVVSSGGVADGASVLSSGALQVASKGATSGSLVDAGGIETVEFGAVAKATILSDGVEFVYGTTSGTLVRSGGHEAVEAHGAASGSVISNGGREVVSSAGSVVAATVSSGGALIVASGGVVSGGLSLKGGEAVISGTMAAGQTVSFGTSGVLQLDNLPGFAAKISGLSKLAQQIDLGGFTFSVGETVSWSQTGTSGTLTVTDGTKTASLTLIGSYSSGNFHLSNDGHGGTFVDDPPAARFAEAIAGFGGRASPGAEVVHAGGTALISASTLVTAATSGR